MPHTKQDQLCDESIQIKRAGQKDMEMIYRIRYEVYSEELGQHLPNPDGILKDALDQYNTYIVAKKGEDVIGFISVTPPDSPMYSIDKYLKREELPFKADNALFELRLLTITKPYRGTMLAFLLMYSAYRYAQVHGGTRIAAIGRLEVLDMYVKGGLVPHGIRIKSGKVQYELVSANMDRMAHYSDRFIKMTEKAARNFTWELDFPMNPEAHCYHGGAFFDRVGNKFDTLENCKSVINADVLDAWFPPSPKVISSLHEYLPWILRTSPPTLCEGLIETISKMRSIPVSCILPGAGSSELMFRVLPELVNLGSKVLILDPTYGEYSHILKNVIGCSIDRFELTFEEKYQVNLLKLIKTIKKGYDLIVLVNPNSPTGKYIDHSSMVELLKEIPETTKVWIDETYIDYVGSENSVERFASLSPNVVVCKSMSKVYALSGVRAAYLCSGFSLINSLKKKTPPWIIGLPGQVAAVAALNDPEYYKSQYRLTHKFRDELAVNLQNLNIGTVFAGDINCLLIHLEDHSAKDVVSKCMDHNLFIRDATPMGNSFKSDVIRIAVKDRDTNKRIVEILKEVLEK